MKVTQETNLTVTDLLNPMTFNQYTFYEALGRLTEKQLSAIELVEDYPDHYNTQKVLNGNKCNIVMMRLTDEHPKYQQLVDALHQWNGYRALSWTGSTIIKELVSIFWRTPKHDSWKIPVMITEDRVSGTIEVGYRGYWDLAPCLHDDFNEMFGSHGSRMLDFSILTQLVAGLARRTAESVTEEGFYNLFTNLGNPETLEQKETQPEAQFGLKQKTVQDIENKNTPTPYPNTHIVVEDHSQEKPEDSNQTTGIGTKPMDGLDVFDPPVKNSHISYNPNDRVMVTPLTRIEAVLIWKGYPYFTDFAVSLIALAYNLKAIQSQDESLAPTLRFRIPLLGTKYGQRPADAFVILFFREKEPAVRITLPIDSKTGKPIGNIPGLTDSDTGVKEYLDHVLESIRNINQKYRITNNILDEKYSRTPVDDILKSLRNQENQKQSGPSLDVDGNTTIKPEP